MENENVMRKVNEEEEHRLRIDSIENQITNTRYSNSFHI
jgi:hypothetical protein